MYKYTEKEKIPSFFLQQASKYMLKCSKITEMDRDIYHALHDVHLAAKMFSHFWMQSVYCKKEKGRANK